MGKHSLSELADDVITVGKHYHAMPFASVPSHTHGMIYSASPDLSSIDINYKALNRRLTIMKIYGTNDQHDLVARVYE